MQNVLMETRVSQVEVTYSSRGNPTYTLNLWHDGLKKHRVIRGSDQWIIELKSRLQVEEWHAKWVEIDSRQHQRAQRDQGKRQQEERKAQAADKTAEAQRELEALAKLLHATLIVNDRVDWDRLKDRAPFSELKPRQPKDFPTPIQANIPREPQRSDSKYQPSLGLFDKIFSSRKKRLQDNKSALFATEAAEWKHAVEFIRTSHLTTLSNHQKKLAAIRALYEKEILAWTDRKIAFEADQAQKHAAVDEKRAAYEAKQPVAIVEYLDLVLSASRYPDYFPQDFDIDYDAAAKTAIIDYRLPGPDDLPTLKSVKYVAARDEFEKQFISEAQTTRQFDDVIYQIVLRTMHELFESDAVGALDAVVVNGIVTAVDRTTGKPLTACILSLRAGRSEFLEINLAQVDPKACFKSLKGVGSSKLYGLSPVPPIMPLKRNDGRFVSAYEVASTLDGSVNLAAMDWEDFEHLIREIFEKEFSSTGGEVKVTQASRDGGVDAIAFDPDPIRGGKIVIQAKRYTNTVGVSAVRDLYGTVVNEGATKGVLVTTSDYGPDSYAFATGKPLVLLSGANLLHMLTKHGHAARINILEAKKLAANRDAN